MESFNKWIRANKLTINFDPTKSCYSVFKRQNKTIPNTYKKGIKIGNHILAYQAWTKYLGIQYISTMNSAGKGKYSNSIKKSPNTCKLRYFVPRECFMTLYNAFIFPRHKYGIEAYTNAKDDYLKKINHISNKILRILQFKPYASDTHDLYSKFKVLKLEDMLKINLCCLTHNLICPTYKVPFAITRSFYPA